MGTRKFLSISLLFILVQVMSFSALSNHVYLPRTDDYVYHIAAVIDAERAILLQQQWLLRTAPDYVHGLFYPLFQFYSPLPYTLAGYLGLIFSHNPLDPFKLSMGLCGFIGGWYAYKLYVYLFHNEVSALLGAVLYLFSPYLLMDVDVRGDFTEAMSQTLFPAVLYYFFRLYHTQCWNRERLYFLLAGVVAYYSLMTTHLLSWITMTLFAGLFFSGLALQERRPSHLAPLVLTAFLSSCLAAWYLLPIALLHDKLYITLISQKDTPWSFDWITQLPTLLAPASLNSQLGYAHLAITPSIGLPLLLSCGYWLYQKEKTPLLKTSLSLFLLAFLIAWSPFDFWAFLPRVSYILQFPYRMLINIDWLGGLLFVPLLNRLFKNKLDRRHLFLGLLFIFLANSHWLKDNYITTEELTFVHPGHPQAFPLIEYHVYLMAPERVPHVKAAVPPPKNCVIYRDSSVCTVTLTAPIQTLALPILYYPHLLSITVNGKDTPYFASLAPKEPGHLHFVTAAIRLPPGSYVIKSQFTGWKLANALSAVTALSLAALGLFLFFDRKKAAPHENSSNL